MKKKMLALLLALGTITTTTAVALANPTEDGLSFGSDDGAEIGTTILTPGGEYRFPLQITENGKTVTFTKEHMDGHTFRLESSSGKDSIESAKMVEVGDSYFFEVKVKSGWPTKQTDASYKLRYQNKSTGKTVYETEMNFSTGYGAASDSYLSTLTEGDKVQVDEKNPVFTKSQLEKIARINGYQKVTFAAGDWEFSANVTDMDNINLLNNDLSIKEIIEKFDTTDFKFLAFPAGTTFKGNGDLTIDVSDIAEDFDGKFHVYRYLNGKMSKLSFTYHPDEETITLSTNQLGRFVISSTDIPDGTVIFGEGSSSGSGDSSSGSSSGSTGGSSSGSSTEKPNPDTGAGVGAMAAVVAMGAAGAVALAARKKK